jgi:ferredoxin-type protein NapH
MADTSASATRARRALQPFDLSLKHHRGYTRARRFVLGLSLVCTFGLPAWHLRARDAESAGQAARSGLTAVRASGLPAEAPAIIGAPGAIDVFGLELVDPLPLLALAVSAGPTWALLWLALPALVLVLLLGRFFCGWVCPYVPILAASNAARGWLGRLGIPLPDVKLPRSTSAAILVAVLAGTALFGAQLAPLIYPPSIIGREVFHAIFYGGLGAGTVLVGLAFAFDTFVSRAGFCRTVCPGGALYSFLGAFSPVTVKLEKSKCTDCTVCDVVCNLGQSPMNGKIDSGCERCGKCVAVCPTDALRMGLGPSTPVGLNGGRR